MGKSAIRTFHDNWWQTETGGIMTDIDFREQIDLDSRDYLNFIIALDEEFKAELPETEYTKFTSLDSCIEQIIKFEKMT